MVGLVGVTLVAWAGLFPNPYTQFVRGIPPPHPYPFVGVAWISAFIAVEVAVSYAIIRPCLPRLSWSRTLLAFVIAIGFLVFGLAQAMHSPPYIWAYIWWLFGVAAVLFVVFLFAVSARLFHNGQGSKAH